MGSGDAAASMVLKVALPVPLSRSFDYLPVDKVSAAPIGSRVLVSFGRSRYVGVVVDHGEPEFDIHKLKRVNEVLDASPMLPEDIVDLLKWASRYYHSPIGEVFSTALPTAPVSYTHLTLPTTSRV